MECFVIMPFSETTHFDNGKEINLSSQIWSFIYNDWIKRAVENYSKTTLKCKRSPSNPGNFVKGIVQDIYNSEIVIADLTGQKPNVYYELGVRHSLRLGTIIITQDLKALPSDLNSYFCFQYNYTNEAHLQTQYYSEFENNIHDKLKFIIENKHTADNPVADFLDLKHYYSVLQREKQVQSLKEQITEIANEFKEIIENLEKVLKIQIGLVKKNHIIFTFYELNSLDILISRFSNSDFSAVNQSDINSLLRLIKISRRHLFQVYQIWESTRVNINSENLTTLISHMKSALELHSELLPTLETIIRDIN